MTLTWLLVSLLAFMLMSQGHYGLSNNLVMHFQSELIHHYYLYQYNKDKSMGNVSTCFDLEEIWINVT